MGGCGANIGILIRKEMSFWYISVLSSKTIENLCACMKLCSLATLALCPVIIQNGVLRIDESEMRQPRTELTPWAGPAFGRRMGTYLWNHIRASDLQQRGDFQGHIGPFVGPVVKIMPGAVRPPPSSHAALSFCSPFPLPFWEPIYRCYSIHRRFSTTGSWKSIFFFCEGLSFYSQSLSIYYVFLMYHVGFDGHLYLVTQLS